MSSAVEAGDGARRYVESFVSEDGVIRAARERASELGCPPVAPATGAALRFLAAALDARAVVEIGTGTGVSALWLLRGMRPDGVLTTVDGEAEHQRLARRAFAEAEIPSGRTRVINGSAARVLPRLADGAYDLVFADADRTEYGAYLTEALRLLRPGGVVAFAHALAGGRVPDPSARDPETVAIRDVGWAVRDDSRLVPMLIGAGDGVLAAAYRP